MASVTILGLADIDYSLVDGRIRRFEFRGELAYDEARGIAATDWETKLMAVILRQRLDVDHSGRGLHAFVRPFLEKHGVN